MGRTNAFQNERVFQYFNFINRVDPELRWILAADSNYLHPTQKGQEAADFVVLKVPMRADTERFTCSLNSIAVRNRQFIEVATRVWVALELAFEFARVCAVPVNS